MTTDEHNTVPLEQIDTMEVDTALQNSLVESANESTPENIADYANEAAEVDENYGYMTRQQINDRFAELLETEAVSDIRKRVEAMKVAFYKIYRQEVENARAQFVNTGGNPEEFIREDDEIEIRFKELYAEYRTRRDQLASEIEQSKENNLKEKLVIIDELKELINSKETVNHTFNQFRELQRRWKEIGAVPQANVKDLWETYHLYVEQFYNYVKINKELKDLDLKKNYETKVRLCEEAERLSVENPVVDAFHRLQKLHEEWRETGPVMTEFKETLWERFKEASSVVNRRHQEHFEHIKEEQKHNFEMKSELCAKLEELVSADYSGRKEWNQASEELVNIQKIWKTIGFAPKKENTKIYERFRKLCDDFFEKKRQFFTDAKSDMDNNYQAKVELCIQAEALAESEEWKKATNQLLELQRQWKEIGPTARKNSEVVWKRFRAACDKFFNRKSEHFGSLDQQYEANLVARCELIDEIKRFDAAENGDLFESIKGFQRRWSEIGFVPAKDKDAVHKEYKELIDGLFAQLRGSERERKMEHFKEKIQRTENSSTLLHERDKLYKKVKQLESDIQLWENNIGFFAKSKNADDMVRDVRIKIDTAREDMAVLIQKIKLIDSKS